MAITSLPSPHNTIAMVTLQPEADFIAHHVTFRLKGDHRDAFEANNYPSSAPGPPTDLSRIVVPALEKGYQLLVDKHRVDLVGYSKILVDEFSIDTFFCLATTVTTDDSEGLTWARVVALFTVLSFASTDLTSKGRGEHAEQLCQWLAEFLSRDLSRWVVEQGGWVRYSSSGVASCWLCDSVFLAVRCGRLQLGVTSKLFKTAMKRQQVLLVGGGRG